MRYGTLDLDRFKTYPDNESIISELVKIRGVGKADCGTHHHERITSF